MMADMRRGICFHTELAYCDADKEDPLTEEGRALETGAAFCFQNVPDRIGRKPVWHLIYIVFPKRIQ